jgi:hypothetical protein
MRVCVPDEEAQKAALKLLLEQAHPRFTSVDGSEASGTDESQLANGGDNV